MPRHNSGIPFPVAVAIDYKTLGDGRPVTVGSGRTVTMSSTLIRFVPIEPLPTAEEIELFIDWPVALHGRVGLRLCVRGSIVEGQPDVVNVKIGSYVFRTRSLNGPHPTFQSYANFTRSTASAKPRKLMVDSLRAAVQPAPTSP
jgi:hypothetical protein